MTFIHINALHFVHINLNLVSCIVIRDMRTIAGAQTRYPLL
jgi:hypothetical protein